MSSQHHEDAVLSSRLGFFGRIDTAVYRVEVVIVVTALIAMSIMVFTDVVYQLVVSITQALDAGEASGWTTILGLLGFVGMMAFAATGPSSLASDSSEAEAAPESAESPSLARRLGIVAAVEIGVVGTSLLLLNIESATVYRLVLIALSVPILRLFYRQQNWKGLATYTVGAVLALIVFGYFPSGYSWSQSYSLLLLLWVGFLGASIAARQRRHLRVDLARKLMPPKWLPHFNAVSYLVAAVFTALVFYLGYIYMFGPDSTYIRPIWDAPAWLPESLRQTLETQFPLPEDASAARRALQVFFVPSEPGEAPDWLKVAAIPVSMAFIFIRFLGHALVFAKMAVRGEEFVEQVEAH